MDVANQRRLSDYRRRAIECTQAALQTLRLAIYPPICQLCRTPTATEHALCNNCANAMEWIANPCKRCGAPLHPSQVSSRDRRGPCLRCKTGKWLANEVYCLAVYQGVIQDAVVAMKQPMSEALCVYFGKSLASQAVKHLDLSQVDTVISVPHHWLKRVTHRHNASENLADAVARTLGKPLLSKALDRVKQGAKQGTLHRAERARNIKDAFQLHQGMSSLKDMHVLIVDDIITTGSTAAAICKPLREVGVRKISFLAVARGLNATRVGSNQSSKPR